MADLGTLTAKVFDNAKKHLPNTGTYFTSSNFDSIFKSFLVNIGGTTKLNDRVDLKTIKDSFSKMTYRKPTPYWYAISSNALTTRMAYIEGYTKTNGTIVGYKQVYLIYRKTGQKVDGMLSEPNGYFRFDNLLENEADYLVLAIDDTYNAVVFDRVAAQV